MKKSFFAKTIRGKVIAMTAGITLAITFITVAICFSVFQSFLHRNQIQTAEFNLQLAASSICSDMEDIIYLNDWCRSNNLVLGYLESFMGKERMTYASREDKGLRPIALSTFDRVKEEYMVTKSHNYITRLIISTDNSNNLLQLVSSSDETSPHNISRLTSMDFYPYLYNSADYQWVGFVDDPFFNKVNTNLVIPIVRPVYKSYNSDVIGWTYMSVSSSLLTDYFRSYPLADDSTLYFSMGEILYRLDGNQFVKAPSDFTIVSDISQNVLDKKTKAQTIRMTDGSRRTLVSRELEPARGTEPRDWCLYQVLSEQQLNAQRRVYFLLIFAICLVILSLGGALMYLLNRTISQPVALVKKKIDAISAGDFSRDESIEWDHEIGDIGKGINDLSRSVVTLMDKRVADEQQKKDLQYQILQSQINPHFLYNTLNSIKWMATIQGASGIAEMTTALARLMKSIAKGTGSLVTLREELDLVKDYFLIQQYRYGGSISIEYHIESEELYQCRIHRFSLQPIIENALFHGIEPKGTAGKIVVDVKRTDGLLDISITDNGIGMTPDVIERVLSNDDEGKTKADFFKQVGIHNVNQRIKYDFGPEYGITIESVPGEYTTMRILIPCVIPGDEDISIPMNPRDGDISTPMNPGGDDISTSENPLEKGEKKL